jgi:hypothetical protein
MSGKQAKPVVFILVEYQTSQEELDKLHDLLVQANLPLQCIVLSEGLRPVGTTKEFEENLRQIIREELQNVQKP